MSWPHRNTEESNKPQQHSGSASLPPLTLPPQAAPPSSLTVVLIELVDEGAHAIIPQLDDAVVKAGEDPWPLGVKAEPCEAPRDPSARPPRTGEPRSSPGGGPARAPRPHHGLGRVLPLPFTRADLVSNLVSIALRPGALHRPGPPRQRPGSATSRLPLPPPPRASSVSPPACAERLPALPGRGRGSGKAGKMAAGRAGGGRAMEAAAGSGWAPFPAWWGLVLAVLAAGEAGWEGGGTRRGRAGQGGAGLAWGGGGEGPRLAPLTWRRWEPSVSPSELWRSSLFPTLSRGEPFEARGAPSLAPSEAGLRLLLRLLPGELSGEEDLHPLEQNCTVRSPSECHPPDWLPV